MYKFGKLDNHRMKVVFIAVVFSWVGRNEGYGLSQIKIAKNSLSDYTLHCKRNYIINQRDKGAYRSLSTLYGCLEDDMIENKGINDSGKISQSFKNKLKTMFASKKNTNLDSNPNKNVHANLYNTVDKNTIVHETKKIQPKKISISVVRNLKRLMVISLSICWTFIKGVKPSLAKVGISKGDS